VPLTEAIASFLEYGVSTAGTRKTYGTTLRALAAEYGATASTADVHADPDRVAAWFTGRWGARKPATWNTNLDALASACGYWSRQGWITGNPVIRLERKPDPEDRDRALSRAQVAAILDAPGIAIRERTLWRMLYETTARADEVLSLDVPDLDPPNRRTKTRRKGGAGDAITWRTGTARLLPRLLKGRRTGPLFLTDRRARVQLSAADLDPESGRARLSYRRAEEMFSEFTAPMHGGPFTLHQLRHSGLSHAAEDGMNTPMLQVKSGHKSIRSLARYARPTVEAVARWEAERDPETRRRT
jgi:integrase/recombinase XerC/integrase/recombinase XerD